MKALSAPKRRATTPTCAGAWICENGRVTDKLTPRGPPRQDDDGRDATMVARVRARGCLTADRRYDTRDFHQPVLPRMPRRFVQERLPAGRELIAAGPGE